MNNYSKITLVSNKKEYLEKTISVFGDIIRSFLLAFVITLLICYLIGFRAYIVNGWSSEPYIEYGSVCFDYKCSYESIKPGDFITFSSSGSAYTTHRVVAVAEKGKILKKDSIIYFTHEGINYKFKVQKDCQIITMATNPNSLAKDVDKFNKSGGEPIEPGILLEHSNYSNFQGRVIGSSTVIGDVLLYLRDNLIQIAVYCLIIFVINEFIKYVPDYIKLF